MTRAGRWVLASILLVGLGVGVWFLSRSVATASIDWRWHSGAIAMLAVLYLLGLAFSCALWRALTANAGVWVTWRRALVGLGALLMGKYVPGKVFGMLGRAASFPEGTGRLRVAALVMAEQAYALMGVLAISLIALCAGTGRPAYAAGAVLALAVPFALPYLIEAALGRAGAFGKRQLMLEWAAAFRGFDRLNAGILVLLPAALALSILSTAAFVPELLGLDLSWQERAQLVGYYGIAVLGGVAVVVLPSGIGARELGFIALSSPLLGVSHAITMAASLRVLTVVTDVLTGLIAVLLVRNQLAD